MPKNVSLSHTEILSALDYLSYLDKRLELVEDTCGEMCHQIGKLQHWLERLSQS
jgi:hypothetical protein